MKSGWELRNLELLQHQVACLSSNLLNHTNNVGGVPEPLLFNIGYAARSWSRFHSEYPLLADIVIATPDTVFQDKPHFAFGIVPGDGIHSVWPEVIGSIRGRTFVLTQQIIGAEEAKTLGVSVSSGSSTNLCEGAE